MTAERRAAPEAVGERADVMTKDAASPTTTGRAPQRPAELPRLERNWADSFPELSRPITPVRTVAPRLLVLGEEVARDLGFDPAFLASAEGVRFLTGESFSHDRPPVAQVYAGHQWGVFTPILGDGRAALLGEHRDRRGRLRDVHLKGIGPTPLSRVDGYAVVGPMLREFLMGEALHALGVPTTRMLAVVATGRLRERDGTALPGAVLARTAASHVRFGSFEYVRAQADVPLLRRLADHVIARHHPQAAGARHPYRALLEEVVGAVAALTAHWMRLGFVHGVLSTDNVLVAAETIDYGPCAFLDAYEPEAFFSSIDRFGRYAYDRQPSIMRWNLERLGEALPPLLAENPAAGEDAATEIVAGFDAEYRRRRADAFRAKLGLARGAFGAMPTRTGGGPHSCAVAMPRPTRSTASFSSTESTAANSTPPCSPGDEMSNGSWSVTRCRRAATIPALASRTGQPGSSTVSTTTSSNWSRPATRASGATSARATPSTTYTLHMHRPSTASRARPPTPPSSARTLMPPGSMSDSPEVDTRTLPSASVKPSRARSPI